MDAEQIPEFMTETLPPSIERLRPHTSVFKKEPEGIPGWVWGVVGGVAVLILVMILIIAL